MWNHELLNPVILACSSDGFTSLRIGILRDVDLGWRERYQLRRGHVCGVSIKLRIGILRDVELAGSFLAAKSAPKSRGFNQTQNRDSEGCGTF